jgi:hypothetical protein
VTIIGILSDSHGHADTTARAVAALERAGATLLLHLGDVETEAVIDELAGRNARMVFGNCDFDLQDLTRHAERMGVAVDHPLGEVVVEGRRIAFTHGHVTRLMTEALQRHPDYLLHGHTHRLRDERVDGVRVINPGALFRAAEYTAAMLDPVRDRLRILRIEPPSPREPE